MLQQDELAVVLAYQEAIRENDGIGWTNCRKYIERRVDEMSQDDQLVEKHPWRTDCVYKTLGYEAF